MGKAVADAAIDLLTDLPNVHHIQKYYRWHLITADPDDDKFVDCAIAGNADCIVTNDKHFRALQNIPFPAVATKSAEEFLKLL